MTGRLAAVLVFFTLGADAQPAVLNLSHDLVSLSIATSNMVPNQPTLDAGPLLLAGLGYAYSRGIRNVTVDPGDYYFLSLQYFDRHVALYQLRNLNVDFQGSNLYFKYVHHLGITVDYASNVVLQNFTMDFLDLPFTQLLVTSVNPVTAQLQFTVPPGWFHPTQTNGTGSSFLGHTNYAFVFRGGRTAPNLGRFEVDGFSISGFYVRYGTGPWATAEVFSRIRPGDTVVITSRGAGEPLLITRSSDVTLRNVQIYSSGIAGIRSVRGTNILFERVYVIPRPGTDRLISTNADGIAFEEPGPNNTLRLSRAIRTADDGFAPNSLIWGTVVSSQGGTVVSVRRQFGNSLGTAPNPAVVFQRRTDGVLLGSAVLTSSDPGIDNYRFNDEWGYTFDRNLNIPAGAAAYSTTPEERGTNFLLERSTVQEQVFARGISLWGLMNSVVQGNYIRNSQMAGILGTHRLFSEDWMSPPLDNVTIRRNVIDGTNTTLGTGVLDKMAGIMFLAQQQDFQPMTVSPHHNITVTDNFVAEPARSAVRMQNVDGGTVTGNTFVNPNNNPYVEGYWEDTFEPYRTQFRAPFVEVSSVGISQTGNTIESNSVRMIVTDLTYRRLAAYAPGLRIRLHTLDAATLTNPVVTFRDADGQSAVAPILTTSPHFFEILIPAAAALGGAVVKLTAGAETRYATLFVDSQDNIPAVPHCTVEISIAGTVVPASGGSFRVLAVTQPACQVPLLGSTVFNAPAPPTGTSLVNFTVSANPGAARLSSVEVSGIPIAVAQGGTVPLGVSKSHTGNFFQGQTAATYSVVVSNAAGPAITSGTVTVTETPPSGLTLVSMAGPGWTCPAGGAACTRADGLAGGLSYPAITVTVNVAANAPSQLTNQVTVSGGGAAQTSASDVTTINSGCVISLSQSAATAPAIGGISSVGVFASCQWTATSNASWLTITSPATNTGNGSFFYSVAPNLIDIPRAGTFSVNGSTFTVNQAASGPPALRFVPVTPCRIADTRSLNGPFGGPALGASSSRDFTVPLSGCNIPASALAYSLNLTVVPLGPLGFLSVWPTGLSQPSVSTLNSGDGRVKANAAIVPAGLNGAITVFASNPTHAIVDINGYFVPSSAAQDLAFYPITPCRLADTRIGTGTFGGPSLAAATPRSFPVLTGSCGIPANAQAYATNMTVVPSGPLGFLSAWPAGSPQPGSSTLNATTGAVTANAAIVPAGTGGAITVIATNDTHLIIDINGYFAPPGPGGMQFYAATPCRVLDTRSPVSSLGGYPLSAGQLEPVGVAGPLRACNIPFGAGAYSLNATVVPPGPMGFLSLWGSGAQPAVSTLNAGDGTVVANAALVPSSNGSGVFVIASHTTHLILDINGYFAQ